MERQQPTLASKLKSLFGGRGSKPSRPSTPHGSLNPFAGYFDRKRRTDNRLKRIMRRFPGLRTAAWKTTGKCEGGNHSVGIVHPGQHKRFCGDDCRLGRRLPRAYNNFKVA